MNGDCSSAEGQPEEHNSLRDQWEVIYLSLFGNFRLRSNFGRPEVTVRGGASAFFISLDVHSSPKALEASGMVVFLTHFIIDRPLIYNASPAALMRWRKKSVSADLSCEGQVLPWCQHVSQAKLFPWDSKCILWTSNCCMRHLCSLVVAVRQSFTQHPVNELTQKPCLSRAKSL